MTETKNALSVFAEVSTETDIRGNAIRASRPVEDHDEPVIRTGGAHRAASQAAGVSKWTLKKIVLGLAANFAFMACWNAPTIKKGVSAVCTVVLVFIGRDKEIEAKANGLIDKAIDVPKPSLLARVLEPAKEAAAKPIEAIKEGTKKAVTKAEAKVEAVQETVKEEADELKDALRTKAPSGDTPSGEQPGFLATAKDKFGNARDAVAEKVKAMQPQPLTPQQVERLRVQRANTARSVARVRVQNQLNYIGGTLNAQAASIANQADAQYWQSVNNNFQQYQGMVNQANQNLRRR